MGNLEKPLTWVLAIVLLGYLFIVNCECVEGTTSPLNSGCNIGHESDVKSEEDISIDIKVEDESINVDSIVDAVLEEIELKTKKVEE
tara:strand:- start:352 stop:612 length:261 start_codon:yes stop_codon:yes gene_type:complete